jgi:hypothetical protein
LPAPPSFGSTANLEALAMDSNKATPVVGDQDSSNHSPRMQPIVSAFANAWSHSRNNWQAQASEPGMQCAHCVANFCLSEDPNASMIVSVQL